MLIFQKNFTYNIPMISQAFGDNTIIISFLAIKTIKNKQKT